MTQIDGNIRNTENNVTLEEDHRRIYKEFRKLYDATMNDRGSRRLSERCLVVDEILARCMAIVYGDSAQDHLNYPSAARDTDIKRFEWFRPE